MTDLQTMLRASLTYEQSRTRYWAEGGRIVMAGLGGPVYLDQHQADRLLTIYFEAGARKDFNGLHAALEAAGGIPWLSSRSQGCGSPERSPPRQNLLHKDADR